MTTSNHHAKWADIELSDVYLVEGFVSLFDISGFITSAYSLVVSNWMFTVFCKVALVIY